MNTTDSRNELLIAISGLMVLVTFDEQGMLTGVICFGADRNSEGFAVDTKVLANTWSTVMTLEPSCVLLEVKANPFDPNQPKDLAPWAPDEGTAGANHYRNKLIGGVAR